MTTTNTDAITQAGRERGFADACDWIEDERRAFRHESYAELAGTLRRALRDPTGADEGLVSALTEHELKDLIGYPTRDAEGAWTAEAEAWLKAYNHGWRDAIADRLAKLG